jgi:hypothetical protein
VKDEIERLLGLDIDLGDQLKRINLPEGWPEETLEVVALGWEEPHGATMTVIGCLRNGDIRAPVRTACANIGVLYERVSKNERVEIPW